MVTGVAIIGCGKSDRERFVEAIPRISTDKAEIANGLKEFEGSSQEEQHRLADLAEDYAEYVTFLKKTSGGIMSMRDIKKTVTKTFDGMSPEERKDFLKKLRGAMK